MDINKLVRRIIELRVANSRLRSRSLIVTLFGDYVSVFSRPIQLSVIVDLMSLFELKESLIRTTINRLLKSGWISYVKNGRNSLYSITADGNRHFALFSRRIYRPRVTQFESDWIILLVDDLSSVLLQKLRRQLLWLGYSPVNPRSFVHPGTNTSEARALIGSLGLQNRVIVGSLLPGDERSSKLILSQTRKKLPLAGINNSYQIFVDTYERLHDNKAKLGKLTPLNSFMLRLLMIHDYRRILLRDPDLPEQYLPGNWWGVRAQSLLREIYALVNEASTQYFAEAIEYDEGRLREAIDQTATRLEINARM